MTNLQSPTPFLSYTDELYGTVAKYLQIKGLYRSVEALYKRSQIVKYTCSILSKYKDEMIAVAVEVSTQDIQAVTKLFGAEQVFDGKQFQLLQDETINVSSRVILLIDRFYLRTEDDVRKITEYRSRCESLPSHEIKLFQKVNNEWVTCEVVETQAAYPTYQAWLQLTVGELLEQLAAEFNTEFFQRILKTARLLNLTDVQLASVINSHSWSVIDKITYFREAIIAPQNQYVERVSEQRMVRDKPFDLVFPGVVSGTGTIAQIVEIQSELHKFFKSLPETSRKRYRGYAEDEFLQMTFKEFFIWFKNHPKFRSLALGVTACNLEHFSLQERIEHLSYQDAYAVLVARELRKLREESRVFVPAHVWSETANVVSPIMKAQVYELLSFYRSRMTLVEL